MLNGFAQWKLQLLAKRALAIQNISKECHLTSWILNLEFENF